MTLIVLECCSSLLVMGTAGMHFDIPLREEKVTSVYFSIGTSLKTKIRKLYASALETAVPLLYKCM